MSNFIYSKAKEAILNADIDFAVDDLRVLLVDNLYTPNSVTHQFVSDIPTNAIKKRSGSLQNISTQSGVLDADDLVIIGHNGAGFSSIIIYKNTGSDSTSRLIANINDSTGLPFPTSSVSSLNITWDNGPNKIIAL